MKKIYAVAATALLTAASVMPASAATIVGLYNTGVDNGGVVLGNYGVTDTHYVVNGGAAVTYDNSAYTHPGGATWISTNGTGGVGGSTNVFSLTFSLAGLDATTASISGFFAADDVGTAFLNGVELITSSNPGYGSLTSFFANDTTKASFLAGDNVLSFSVLDTGGAPTALLVSGLSGTASAVPEPATWAMMLLGFGMIGYGLRRRQKQTVRVTYA